MSNPREEHWKVVKSIQNTMGVRICFTGKSAKLVGFSDTEFGGNLNLDSSRTALSYVFYLGGIAISWEVQT